MMCLAQNKQVFWYALFQGETDTVDSDGNYTGGKNKVYGDPVKAEMNISAARGLADVEQFGINENYNRTIVTDDLSCPINTDTILWIGIPTKDPYNYRVTRVAKSLNSIVYAIQEVSAGGNA